MSRNCLTDKAFCNKCGQSTNRGIQPIHSRKWQEGDGPHRRDYQESWELLK